jgi:hypothetical protein
MKIVRIPVLALASAALVAPFACLAAAPPAAAAHNCAQALASRLNVRVVGVNEQPNLQNNLLGSAYRADQYVLTPQTLNGAQGEPMVCTVDSNGKVLSLQRVAPVDTQLPLLGAASQ